MNDTIEIRTEEKKDRGFTLIELLIVIVILGILATVTVFAVGGITADGQKSACKAEYKTFEVAIEAHKAQNPGVTTVTNGDLTAYFNTVPKNYHINASGAIASLDEAKCQAPPTP